VRAETGSSPIENHAADLIGLPEHLKCHVGTQPKVKPCHLGKTYMGMTTTCGWARLWPTVRPPHSKNIRAGAWYPVIKDDLPDRVTIRLGAAAVDVPRRMVEVRARRPNRFTVVHRIGYIPTAGRHSLHKLGKRYAVCPNCQCRFGLIGEPEKKRCPSCGHEGEVAWWETT
jgi:hypothetical protein